MFSLRTFTFSSFFCVLLSFKGLSATPINVTELNATNVPNQTDIVGLPLGAPMQKDVNDPEIRKLAELSCEKYSQIYRKAYEPLVAEIISASEQLVAGSLYKLKVKFGESDCNIGEKDNCHLILYGESQICDVDILSRPWLDKDNGRQVTLRCSLKSSRN